jgi:hypothetical protein
VTDLLLLALSIKPAQQRSTRDLASQLRQPAPIVCAGLYGLWDRGLVRRWPDGGWGLSGAGNRVRNGLTARPLPHVLIRTIELEEAA